MPVPTSTWASNLVLSGGGTLTAASGTFTGTALVNSDGVAQEAMSLYGRRADGVTGANRRGGAIDWYDGNNTATPWNTYKASTFINGTKVCFDSSAQSSRADTGAFWVDVSNGSFGISVNAYLQLAHDGSYPTLSVPGGVLVIVGGIIGQDLVGGTTFQALFDANYYGYQLQWNTASTANNLEWVRLSTTGILDIQFPIQTTQLTSTGLITGPKVKLTIEGGIAVKVTNKTGAASVAGQLVKADTATNDAVILAAAGDVECFGVFYEAGIADGAEAWVAVAGIADVAFDDNVGPARGDWVATGVLAGYARAAATPAASPQHFEEIGHCIETVAAGGAGTHVLARCVLHFN